MLIVALHTAAVYAFLLLGLRFVGRRLTGQLTVIDFVAILLLGSAVETSMVAGNTSLPAGLVSAGTLLVMNATISRLVGRSRWVRSVCSANAVVLVRDGKVLDSVAQSIGLSHVDVIQSLRARGQFEVARIKYAVLESDGEINVVPIDSQIRT